MQLAASKNIHDSILNLLKLHHSDKVNVDSFKMEFGNTSNFLDPITKSRQVSFAASNLEKICFCIGPGQFLKSNPFLFCEENIKTKFSFDNSKPVDFAYKVDYQGSTKYMGFIENKILETNTNLESTVKEAVKQIVENYLLPLKENSEEEEKNNKPSLYFKKTDERRKNFTISICVFNPKVYLNKAYNFLNYCDNKETNLNLKFKNYGFVMLTVFIDIESIKSVDGLQIEFDKFFKNTNDVSLSLVVPNLIVFNGYVQRDVHNSILNTSITARFEELSKLPYYNVSSNSRITNTRDLVEDDDNLDKKLNNNIIETIIKNYKRKQEKSSENIFPINLSETYRSLGAKAREISFYVPQTIVVLDDDHDETQILVNELVEKRMSQKSYYLTCNMNLIDGQHSSRHISRYLKIFKENNLDNEYQAIIKKIYGRNYSTFDIDNFKRFLFDHHIIIGFKGFSLEEVAQQAATNQNNIRKQSKVSQVTNKLREKILKLTNYYNDLDEKYKLKVNKSTWSNPSLVPKDFNVISPEVLTNVFGVWSKENEIFKKNKEINLLLGKSNAITNAKVGTSYEQAINWFIKVDSNIFNLNKKIENVIETYKKFEDSNDTNLEILKKDFIKNYFEMWNLSKTKEVDLILSSTPFEDIKDDLTTSNTNYKKDNYEQMLIFLEDANKKIIDSSEIYEDRLKVALKIYTYAYEYYSNNNNGKNVPLLKLLQTDNLYYVINYLNIVLRIEMNKNYNEVNLLDKVKDNNIINALIKLNENLLKGEQFLINSKKNINSVNLAKNCEMDNDLFKILFKI